MLNQTCLVPALIVGAGLRLRIVDTASSATEVITPLVVRFVEFLHSDHRTTSLALAALLQLVNFQYAQCGAPHLNVIYSFNCHSGHSLDLVARHWEGPTSNNIFIAALLDML